jgi:hypothetical protein
MSASMAISVPDRPTPAEQCTSIGEEGEPEDSQASFTRFTNLRSEKSLLW